MGQDSSHCATRGHSKGVPSAAGRHLQKGDDAGQSLRCEGADLLSFDPCVVCPVTMVQPSPSPSPSLSPCATLPASRSWAVFVRLLS